METVGQILGIISFVIAFVLYQIRDKKALLIVQTLLVFVAGMHYFFLEAYAAMAMNFFGILRNIVYFRKDIFKWKHTPIAVSVFMMLVGIFTASGIWSILVIIGLTVNTYCLSFENIQHFKISILISSPLVLIYNIVVFSVGGILLEAISIVSAAVSLARSHKAKNDCKN